MNRAVSNWRFAVPSGALATARQRREERIRWLAEGLSRRQFLGTASAVPGLVMAAGWWSKVRAAGGDPQPIPHVIPLGGGLPDIHIQLPGIAHGNDADPSTITDFNGHLGYAIIDGTGTRTNLATGAVTQHPYEVDLRFMKGEFVTADGQHCHGAFALI